MTRRFTTRTAGVLAALFLASCIGDSTGPQEARSGLVNIAPDFNIRGFHAVDVNRVLIRFTRPNSAVVVYDTIVAFPAASDTLDLSIHVPINGASQQFLMTILMIDDPAADTVFKAGPQLITATANGTTPPPTPVSFVYVGTGAKAAGVRFLTTPTQVLFGDTVVFTAEAYDSNNVTIPGTPIVWSSSDTTRAKLPSDSIGRVVGGIARGPVTITAALLTPPSASSPLLIQPKPNAVVVQGGSGQTGAVGSPLSQPVTVRVNAADNLGVAGVIVNFAVTTGGGTLSQAVDTTDLNGDASVIWTLGAALGAQSVGVTVPAVTGGSVSVPATGVVGTPKQLAFQVQPSNVPAATAIAPAVKVVAQDTFGNTVASFTGNVTVAIGANPGLATLGGTTTVAAVAGVATFSNLTLNNLGTAYTLVASATGLTSATSAAFNVAGGVPAQLVMVQQPANTQGGTAIVPAITVEVRDAFNNPVPGATNTITAAIGNNPAGGTLSGTLSVAAVGGVATFNNLSIDKAGTPYTLTFTATGLTPVTSANFDVTAGPATTLGFSTQPPSSAVFQSPFVTVVEARDAGGNVATSFTGAVTLGIGTNPGSGTLFGTTTVNAVAGVATFSGISIDNLGAGYTLTANATGLAGAASVGLNVVAPANANVWINLAGGTWNTASNWSKGTVPVATDTVMIRQSGTYTVGLDVSATVARLDVGGLSGTQTLSIQANTLTMAGDGAFNAHGQLILGTSGAISGPGILDIFGGMDWGGGSLSGGGGAVRVPLGGILTISGAATRTLSGYTLEISGVGGWSAAGVINSGNGAVLRVAPGGVLNITGNPSMVYNLGGAAPVLDNQGTINRTISSGTVAVSANFNNNGSVTVSTGTLQAAGGGSSAGVLAVGAGAVFDFAGGTHTLAGSSNYNGAGTITVSGGTVNAAGAWTPASTQVNGGTFNYNGTTTAGNLDVTSGTLGGGAGSLLVVNAMTWSGGSLNGAGGRVQANTLAVSGSGSGRALSNYTLELVGTGTWATTTSSISSGNGGVLRVLAGGQLDLTGDFGMDFNLGGATSLVQVQGTVLRHTGTGNVTFTMPWQNDGITRVQTGAGGLTLAGGSNAATAGQYIADAATNLNFQGGTHTLGAASSVSGAGTIAVAGGTVNASGSWAVTGNTQVSGGTLNFSGAAGATTNLAVSGGVLGGSAGGNLQVSGAMTWSGGSLSGSGGKTTVLGSATLAVSGNAAGRSLSNYTLDLQGSGTWATTTSNLSSGNGGTLRIGGGTLDVTGDFGIVFNLGGATSNLSIAAGGTLRRSTSVNPVQFATPVNDSGTVQVQAGTLQLDGGGTSTGNYITTGTATLSFGGGTHNLGATSAFTGAGTSFVQVPGGTVNAAGSWVQSGTTRVNGGTINFNGAAMSSAALDVSAGTVGGAAGALLDVGSSLTWTGGNFSGSGGTTRVTGTGAMNISGTTARSLSNYNLELAASGGIWTGTHTISSGVGAAFRVLPGGLLDIQGDASFIFNLGGATSTFDNQGSVVRTTSTGTVTINAPFTTNSVVNVSSGTLALGSGGSLDGSMVANSPGTISLAGGTFAMGNALSLSGTGTAQLNGATLNGLAAGDTVRASIAVLTLNTGSLSPAAGATIKVTGGMTWAGAATLSGGGKTLITGSGSLQMTGTAARSLSGHTVDIATAGGSSWSGAFTMNSGVGAILRVEPGASFAISAPVTYAFSLGGATSLFDVQGSLQANPGAAATVSITGTFNNTGNVVISSGTLSLANGGLETGPVNIASGAFLDYAGGTHILNNGVVTSGAGVARLQAGTITNSTVLDSARFVNLTLNGGTVNQVGGILVTGGTLDWAGGANISGTGTVAGNNVLTFSGTAARNLASGIFENRGNLTWSGAFTLNSGTGAILRNAAGRSFIISANSSFLFSLGGARSVFQNLGTLNIAAPAAVAMSASFNNTSTLNITSGSLQLSGGAQLGGATAFSGASNVLDLSAGTDTLKTGATITGAGFVQVSGATLTADSGATFSIPNLQLSAGNLTHEALIQVSSTFGWSGGGISSNTVGLGGTTRLLSGALGNINNTTGVTLQGTHTFNVATGATLNYTGTQNISTGSGAVIQNAGTINWQGSGSIPFNLGGAQSQYVQTAGTLLRNVGAGTVSLGAAVNWSGGTIQVATGALQLAGGSVTSFAGSATVTPANGLDLSGGTFTLSGNFLVTGDLLVSGANLTMAGRTIGVTANFSTSGSGLVTMTNSADSLDVTGNVTFGGALGTTNAGVIRTQGNFATTGASSFRGLAQSAAVAHRVRLNGPSSTISFLDPVNSFFRRLLIAKNAGTSTQMLTDVRTTFFSMLGGTYSFTGSAGPPMTQLIADTVAGASSPSVGMFSPMVLVVNAALVDSQVINVDTVVFAGSGQTILTTAPGGAFGNYTYQSIRVAQTSGTALLGVPATLTLTKDLVVSSGLLSLNTKRVTVGGNFSTIGSGALGMTNAGDSLSVTGNVSFGGGSTVGTMTTGVLEVKGNFSQSGATNSFAPSTAHRTRFNLPGSATVQQIAFANPTTSFFDSLELNRGTGTRGTVNFQTDARINRGLAILNSTDVTGPTARISIVGGSLTASQSTTSPTMLTTRALELAVTPPALANMVGAVNISPDTVVINAGIATLPTASGLRYNSIRINTGATITIPSDTITRDLHIASGTASIPTATFRVGGKLRTTATGSLAMPVGAGAPNLTVVDSAIFAGGSTSGQLQTGTLTLLGSFLQQAGTSNLSFSATTGHTTVFAGSGTQTVSFASPGAAASTFGNLFIGRAVAGSSAPTGITINSAIFVAGTIQDTSTNGAANDSIVSSGQVVTAAGGISTGSQFVLNNTTLVLNNYTTFNTSGLKFNNMNPASTYLSLTRNAAGSHSVTGVAFNTPVTAGVGKFINLQTGANVYTFQSSAPGTPPPSGMTGNYVRSANATLIWIGISNP